MVGNFSQIDFQHIRQALKLAALGTGQVSPSPLVGCVIVSATGEIVGEGSYFYDDVIHAEAAALAQAGERARGGTAYVSLEPHHYKHRTLPCTLALISAGIKRVVCPIEDPNPLVSGKGFAYLRECGVEVVTGILADEAAKLNEKFIIWHRLNRPFVHIKLVMSLDRRISLKNSVSTTPSNIEAATRVQNFRHEHDAILVSVNTVLTDNPSLTDRSGKPRRRKLVRVVLDNCLQIPLDSTLVNTADETPTLVISSSINQAKVKILEAKGVHVTRVNTHDLKTVLKVLKDYNLQSILVEGGTEIFGAFCDAKLVDKVSLMVAPIIIGGKISLNAISGNDANSLVEAFNLENIEIIKHGEIFEITGYPKG